MITDDFDELIRTITTQVTARVLVGPDLCRNKQWKSLSLNFTQKVFVVAFHLRLMPWILRPLAWVFLLVNPAWYSVRNDLSNSKRLLRPLIEAHKAAESVGTQDDSPPTVLEWMVSNARTELEANLDTITCLQTLLIVASTFALSHTISMIFYDLCDYPQYIQELREEAEQCFKQSGRWDRSTLDNMRKIESFMCESQRLNPSMMRTFPNFDFAVLS